MGEKLALVQAGINVSYTIMTSYHITSTKARLPIAYRVLDKQKRHFASFSYNFTTSRWLKAARKSFKVELISRAKMG